MANEKSTPAPSGERYFKPAHNETLVVATYLDKEQKTLGKMHKVTLVKGRVYCADKPHEIEACLKAKLREVSKPAEKVEDIE